VANEIGARAGTCSIIEVDKFPLSGGVVNWVAPKGAHQSLVRDRNGVIVDVSEFDVGWWRRVPNEIILPDDANNSAADRALALQDTRAAAVGVLTTDFDGQWVSDPGATLRAENKLLQLRTASAIGLPIPRTVVTQDAKVARAFCEDLDYRAIIKPVRGHWSAPVLTGRASPELLAQSGRIKLSPAIYQELIEGSRHLRVNCFGDSCHTFQIETDQLDWRVPLATKVSPVEIDPELSQVLVKLVDRLGLSMGIIDLKLTPDEQPVFLEINPQGQFLFLDGLCATDLLGEFTDFLTGS
jgi:glutathione synthase/RimK-type ligase-like ATP-grasp enzyme